MHATEAETLRVLTEIANGRSLAMDAIGPTVDSITECIVRGWLEEGFRFIEGLPIPIPTYRVTEAGRARLAQVAPR